MGPRSGEMLRTVDLWQNRLHNDWEAGSSDHEKPVVPIGAGKKADLYQLLFDRTERKLLHYQQKVLRTVLVFCSSLSAFCIPQPENTSGQLAKRDDRATTNGHSSFFVTVILAVRCGRIEEVLPHWIDLYPIASCCGAEA